MTCPYCRTFINRVNKHTHIKEYVCDTCGTVSPCEFLHKSHQCETRNQIGGKRKREPSPDERSILRKFPIFERGRTRPGFGGLQRFIDYKYTGQPDMFQFLENFGRVLKRDLKTYMEENNTALKYCWPFQCTFERPNGETFEHTFRSTTKVLYHIDDFEDVFEMDYKDICIKFDEFLEDGSGSILISIDKVATEIYKYNPTRAASYIPTPPALASKRAIINVQNKKDNLCFLYSVLAKLKWNPQDSHRVRINKYKPYIDELHPRTNFPSSPPPDPEI